MKNSKHWFIIKIRFEVDNASNLDLLAVSCGRYHLACLTSDGDICTVGFGEFGRLGLKDQESRHVLERVNAQYTSADINDMISSSNSKRGSVLNRKGQKIKHGTYKLQQHHNHDWQQQ